MESSRSIALRLAALPPHQRAALEARLLSAGPRGGGDAADGSVQGGPAPLSFAQQRLWFLDQLDPESSAYNMPAAMRVPGRLDPELVERSLRTIVARHAILRTTFGEQDSSPVQVVHDSVAVHVPLVDLGRRARAERERIAAQLAREEALRPFSLAEGPLLRARVLRLGDDDHVLLLTMHHIVSDGWSFEILFRELSACYEALAHGREPALEPLPLQYADYARRQRRELAGERLERLLEHWRGRLAGALRRIELPTDRPAERAVGMGGSTHSFALPRATTERLDAFTREEGVTHYMVGLTAFVSLLHRYSGQTDLVLGTAVANRATPELEALIGFFVNNLVLRVDLSGRPTFREALRRVRDVVLEAMQHQDLPFERLVEELRPERSPRENPLFQVMFVLHRQVTGTVPAGEPRSGLARPGGTGTAKFNLSFLLEATGGGITGIVEYRTELFDPATIERMAGHFGELLRAGLDGPDRPIDRLPWLARRERRQVRSMHGVGTARGRQPCLHEVVACHARSRPRAPAVRLGRDVLDYAALEARAASLARRLVDEGVGRGDLVALAFEPCFEMVVSVLAAFKAGAGYLPLDPAYPEASLRFMVEDARPRLLLTTAGLRGRLPASGVRSIAVDEEWDRIERLPAVPAERAATERDVAYVIYTSGSTGRPKGVVVPHRGLHNVGDQVRAAIGIRPDGLVLQFAAFSFDASMFEMASAIVAGACLVLLPRRQDLSSLALDDPRDLERLVAVLPPSLLASLEDGGAFAPATLVLVGEAFSAELVAPWLRRGCSVFNAYGPTETTIWSTIDRVRGADRRPLIGAPVRNTRAYVLDGALEPTPVGVRGELYVGGLGITWGYLRRPGLTAERFLPDPFWPEPGARMYRTGDVACLLPDGRLRYLGRADQQVKVRGFRIELGEVESVLDQHPAVQRAVVTRLEPAGRPDAAYLCAHVAGGRKSPDADELRRFAADRLPAHMVPSAWVVLGELPLLPNGKVDRARLPAPEPPEPAAAAGGGSRGPLEEVLAAMVGDLLGARAVGRAADFFSLGGHSLLVTRLLARVRQRFGVSVPLRDFFDRPTVEHLAASLAAAPAPPAAAGATVRAVPRAPVTVPRSALGALRGRGFDELAELGEGALASGAPANDGEERVAVLPASYSQQRLWFLDRLEPGGSFYNMPIAVPLAGHVEVSVLRRALGRVVARHEALRTVFAEVEGEPVQVVRTAGDFALPLVDLTEHPIEEREARARRAAAAEARAPFDLETGPLVRAKLLRTSDRDHVFLLTLHHAVADGWSLGIVMRELDALYRAGAVEEPAPPPVQFGDYALWERRHLRGAELDALLGYWRARLAGIPAALELPFDHPRPRAQSHRGAQATFEVDARTTAALGELARGERATLFMALLAAFQTLLYRWSGERDVAVGSPVANRGLAELEGVVGFFVNNLVLRTRVDGAESFRALLSRVREQTLADFEHQGLPFDRLVEEVHPERLLSHNPLFQVMLVLQNTEERAGDGADGPPPSSQAADAGTGTAKFDLLLAVAERGGRLYGTFEYDTDLFEAASIEAAARRFVRLLGRAVRGPDEPLDALDLVAADERRALRTWSRPAVEPAPGGAGVLERFLAWARETPDAAAVREGEQVLTYGQLAGRAARLAHELRSAGLREGGLAGVCVERSADLVVAMAATLAAGGAWALVDPCLPPERAAALLRGLGADVLVLHARTEDRAPRLPVPAVHLDRDSERIAARPCAPPERSAADAGRAFVGVDVGGAGGGDRGFAHDGRSLRLAAVEGAEELFRGARRVAWCSPVFSSLLPTEVWGTLCRGGELVVVAAHPLLAPRELTRELRDARAELLFLPPSAVRAVVDEVPGAFGGLETLVVSGEPLRAAWIGALLGSGPPRRLLHGFEFIECAGLACVAELGARDAASAWAPIGRPLAGTRLFVLDAARGAVPPGVPGELWLGGPRLARAVGDGGLEGAPADEVLEREGPVARTGDRARWGHDGRLEFLGRADRVARLRGFRVQLGDVEAHLCEHPSVARCAVHPWTFGEGDERLVAWFAARGEGTTTASELRRFLRARMPEHMVPATFLAMDVWPDDASRDALPPPDTERPDLDEPYEPPRTATERALVRIWAEVFGLERVGVHDNFFKLGGHSLLAAKVTSRAADAFGVALPLRRIFETPTIAALAESLDAGAEVAAGREPAPIVPVGRGEPLPLSFAQQRLWFLDRLQPGSAFYNMPVSLALSGAVDVDVLRRALRAIGERHEILRTRFVVVGDEPRQVVDPQPAWDLRVEDLRSLAPGPRRDALQRVAREEAEGPFDLERGPLVRCAVALLGDEESRLFVTLHHVVGDGWSLEVFFRELTAIYEALPHEGRSPLPELRLQYGDYAAWQRRWLSGPVLDEHVEFWRERLADLPPLHGLPTDRPRPAVQSFRGDVVSFRVGRGAVDELEALGRTRNATLFMTLLAAFQTLVSRWSLETDVVVGSPVANRPRPELETLIGPFVNVLALRADLSGNPSFVEVVDRARETVLEGHRHQAVPFEELVERLQPERHLDRHPIFQLSFVLQNPQRGGGRAGAAPADPPEDAGTRTARFDLTLAATETDGGLHAAFEYSTELFDAATVEGMADAFVALLRAVVRAPETGVQDLPLAGPHAGDGTAEGPATDFGPHRSVAALAVDRMRRRPETTAVAWEGGSWTYGELEAASASVARALRAAGCGPESAVGLFLERSPRLVAAVLGTLRAGAAFVPLDPEQPRARSEEVAADAEVEVVLADAELLTRAEGLAGTVLAVEAALAEAEAGGPPPADPLPGQSAYVLFTSGSTGRPKGCVNTHEALRNRLLWMQEAMPLAEDDVVLQKTPFTFDVSVWELVWPFLAGARLVLARPGGHRDPAYLAALIREHGVTTAHFVPSMLQAFLAEPEAAGCASLRRVMCSGEALTPSLRDRCHETLGAELYNLYGPTEAAIDVTWWRCDRAPTSPVVPIGHPIANTRIRVLDAALRPVPAGVPGELCIAGVGLARGYARRPGWTAERFVPDPLSRRGERLYRTGDRGRVRADGSVEYLGRLDRQVKVRGVRIEPEEIEARLARHPGVERAAVAVRDAGEGDVRLVAWIVPSARTALPVLRGLESFEPPGDGLRPSELVLENGLAVDQLQRGETEFLYREIFADARYLRHGVRLDGARLVVDVGAHVGLFSLYAALCAPGVRILAFEPVPELARLARRNLARYAVDAEIVEAGLGDETGEFDLTFFPGLGLLSGRHTDRDTARRVVETFVRNEHGDASAGELDRLLEDRLRSVGRRCPIGRLSDHLRQRGVERVDLLKIDAEKSELEVLAGIDAEDWPRIEQVVLEVHAGDGRVEAASELLERNGFSVRTDADPSLAGLGLVDVYAVRSRAGSGEAGVPRPRPPFRWCSAEALVDDARRALSGALPEALVPAEWRLLPALPSTASGKLDRRALEGAGARRVAGRGDSREPRTERERAVAAVWAEVLGCARVGIDDDFFDLGGHSLLATRVAARLRQRLGIEVPTRLFFERPTIAGQVEALALAGEGTPAAVRGEERSPVARNGRAPTPALDVDALSDEEVARMLERMLRG